MSPATALQAAAAAEEAVQEAEAAADMAAARIRLQQPAGAAVRRQLSAEADSVAAGSSISRAGSCQLSEDGAASADVGPSAVDALEAQETLLQLSKAMHRPVQECLQFQSSCNLACHLAMLANADGAQGMFLAAAEQEACMHDAPNSNDARMQSRGAAPLHLSPQACSAFALFKPTPQKQGHGQQSGRMHLSPLQLFTGEHRLLGANDRARLPLAVLTDSVAPAAPLASPFAKASALQPHGHADIAQTVPAGGMGMKMGRVSQSDRAGDPGDRIKAHRKSDAAQQLAGAVDVRGRWTVAQTEGGWAAVPQTAANSAFPRHSEVQRMWQQCGTDDTKAQLSGPDIQNKVASTGAESNDGPQNLRPAGSQYLPTKPTMTHQLPSDVGGFWGHS